MAATDGRRMSSIHAQYIVSFNHYDDVTMSGMASQITSLTIVYSTVYQGVDQRKLQSPTSLAFVRGIHQGPVNSPHKWPVTRKPFPLDDVIMQGIWNLGISNLDTIFYTDLQFLLCMARHGIPKNSAYIISSHCTRNDFINHFKIFRR